MKRTFVVLLTLMAFTALPMLAQEKEKPKEAAPSMEPPKPLADDFCKWMIGEWEGWSTSPMGKSKDWQKVEMGLDKQFVMTHYNSKMTEMTPDQMKAMAEAYGMTKEQVEKMKDMTYKGMGPMTINPMTGEYVGYWFDNWRGMYKGTGKREGNKITMNWEGPMGTSMRTIENVGDDKMVQTYSEKDMKGNVVEGKTEMTRKKMTMKK